LIKSIRVLLVVLILAAFVAGASMLVLRKKRQLKAAPKYGMRPRTVTVVEAREGDLSKEYHYLAVVEPARRSELSARVTADVMEVLKDEGDPVKVGETLVRLDDRDIQHRIRVIAAQIEQAQADLAANEATVEALERTWKYQKSELERARPLTARDLLAHSELDRREAQEAEARGKLRAAGMRTVAVGKRVAALEAQKAELKTQLTYYRIRGPYAGVVAVRRVDPGDLASPRTVLIEVEDTSALRLSFDIPQTDLPAVRTGLPLRFTARGERRSAKLSVLFPALTEARMLRAEARLSGAAAQNLSSGAYVPVSVVTDTRKGVTLVPRSSLIDSPDGKPYVFVVQDGRLQSRRVDVLGHADGETALKGVKPGERVVRHTFLGWTRLTSGEKVEAVP
jgi:RND family efflux transporter MFP subunit